MYISISGGEHELYFYIFDNEEIKPYFKQVQPCADFLCDYYNFTINKEIQNYILDYLNLPQNKKQEITDLLYVEQYKEKLFREIFEFVLSDYYGSLKKYSLSQRMAAYQQMSDTIIEFSPNFEIFAQAYDKSGDTFPDEKMSKISEINMLKILKYTSNIYYGINITFNNLWDFICFCINKVIECDIPIKKCHNCGKFFYPSSRIDEIYCNYEFKNGKTCKEIGYSIKVDNSVVLKEYRKAYKTKNAWKNRNKDIPGAEKAFINWYKKAKEMLKQVQDGTISEQCFLEWLKNNK